MAQTISPEALASLRDSGKSLELVDVRTPMEFRELHVDFARNIPLSELDAAKLAAEQRGAGPLYVICRTGSRASQACDNLTAAGIAAVNVAGGTLAWDAAGLPVIRGTKSMSLERQVRILIGSLVLASSLLAYFENINWAFLAMFFGGGLIFSGITDFCGLALILARMPWNQVTESKSESFVAPSSCSASRHSGNS